MTSFDAKLYNGFINVVDGNGVTQTFYPNDGTCIWRDYNGQYGCKKEYCSCSDFFNRIKRTYD